MKKGKKLLSSLLLVSAMALTTACGTGKNPEDKGEIYEIYQLAVDSGATDLTYEEWLATIKGEKGDTGATGATGPQGVQGEAGKKVLLQTTSTHIQWKYEGDEEWQDLVALDSLKGPQGAPGAAGSTGPQGIPGTDGATWLTGKGLPADTLGKVGDFYLDSVEADVYTKTTKGWEFVVSINGGEETVVTELNEGIYKTAVDSYEEDGVLFSDYIYLEVDENSVISNVYSIAEMNLGTGVPLEMFGLIPVSIEGNVVTVATEGEPLTDLTAGTYTIDQDIVIYGDLVHISTTMDETGVSLTDVVITMEYNLIEMGGTVEYEMIESNLMKITFTFENDSEMDEVNYYRFYETSVEGEYLIETEVYIPEDYESIVYGIYNDKSYELDRDVTLNLGDGVAYITIGNRTFSGTYEFTYGSIEDELLEIEFVSSSFKAGFELKFTTHTFDMYDEKFDFLGEYYHFDLGYLELSEKDSKYYMSQYDYETDEYIDPVEVTLTTIHDCANKVIVEDGEGNIYLFDVLDESAENLTIEYKEFVGEIYVNYYGENVAWYNARYDDIYKASHNFNYSVNDISVNIDEETIDIYAYEPSYVSIHFSIDALNVVDVNTYTYSDGENEVTLTLDETTRVITNIVINTISE